jgi:glycerophosphoryl diester phosphodiesterase
MPRSGKTRWDRLVSRRARATGPLVIAHIGARAIAPENTLAALNKAADLGAEMVEVDVHLTRDGTATLVHDRDLRRCSDAARRWPRAASYDIGDHDWNEVRRLDAGAWFVEAGWEVDTAELVHYRSGAVHPPSLAECLSCVRDRSMLLNVEIKSQAGRVDEAARVVVDGLRTAGMFDVTIVSSFDFDVLRAVRRLSSEVATAALTSDAIPDPVALLRDLDADAYHPQVAVLLGPGATWTTDGLLATEAIRRSGRGVNAWTVNSEDVVRALAASKVSGIISDHPDRVLSQLIG